MTLVMPRRAARAATALLAASLLALGLSACGGEDSVDTPTTTPTTAGAAALPSLTEATLVLDFLPNAVHAGIYRAVEQGYYRANNLDLTVIQPTSTADTLKLIDAGQADIGIADGIDLANQIADGRSARAIGAVVQRPLSGLIARADTGIESGRDFEGKTVGVTGVPSDTAIVNTVVRASGGDPAKVKTVTIGFNGVQALESGRVAAFTGFWPADGVQVDLDGFPTTIFRLDESSGLRYPGLVFFSTQSVIDEKAPVLRAFLDATIRGYEETIADPAAGLSDLLAQVPSLDAGLTQAQLEAYGQLFQAGAPRFGALDTDDVAALSEFLVKEDLIANPITPERYGTNDLLPDAAP